MANVFDGYNKTPKQHLAGILAILEVISLTGAKSLHTAIGRNGAAIILARLKAMTGQAWLYADLEGREFTAIVKDRSKKNAKLEPQELNRKLTAVLSARIGAGQDASLDVISSLVIAAAAKTCHITPEQLPAITGDAVYEAATKRIIDGISIYLKTAPVKCVREIETEMAKEVESTAVTTREKIRTAMGMREMTAHELIKTLTLGKPVDPKMIKDIGNAILMIMDPLVCAYVVTSQHLDAEVLVLAVWIAGLSQTFTPRIEDTPSFVTEDKTDAHRKGEILFSQLLDKREELERQLAWYRASADGLTVEAAQYIYGLKEDIHRLQEAELILKNTEWAREQLKEKLNNNAKQPASVEKQLRAKQDTIWHKKGLIRDLAIDIDSQKALIERLETDANEAREASEDIEKELKKLSIKAGKELLSRIQTIEDAWRFQLHRYIISREALAGAAFLMSWDRCKLEQALLEIQEMNEPTLFFDKEKTGTYDVAVSLSRYVKARVFLSKGKGDLFHVAKIEFEEDKPEIC